MDWNKISNETVVTYFTALFNEAGNNYPHARFEKCLLEFDYALKSISLERLYRVRMGLSYALARNPGNEQAFDLLEGQIALREIEIYCEP